MLWIFLVWSAECRIAFGAVDFEQVSSEYGYNASVEAALTQEAQMLNQENQDMERQIFELQLKMKSQACSYNWENASSSLPTGVSIAAIERQLAQQDASSSTSGSSTMSDDGGDHRRGEHGYQHDALIYLVVVLIIGTGILHLTTFPMFHKLPFTVVLFVLGMLTSGIMQNNPETFGMLGDSYEMWMDIDPHLLIFTMLPVLLTGDAMALDTSVAKRVANQCIWLAGPGVLAGSFGTASFLYIYLKWDFLLCLCCGAILSATDPVAVVGLLKELGASPTLTVQIQGESLLNDGTAMVLFNVAYKMLQGEQHNVKSILILLVYMVGCSWFLGMVIGGAFATWIKHASNRLEDHSNMVQISLTICCAYGSFVFSEGVIGLNGVLSTVATALVLADTIWPKIVSPEAMHEVWHTFEYIGNTLIFFLAGAIGGRSLFMVEYMDVVHLMIIYVVLLFLRASVMFGSRPILKLLSPDRTSVTAADAAVMTWGGLRGAVGLALAIQVMRDKAGGNIGEQEANRVFFFTAGIAFLTLIVNATTCPSLVDSFGMASTSNCKTKVMLDVVQRLVEKSESAEGQVKTNLDHMLHEVREHLTRGLNDDEFETWSCLQRKRGFYNEGHGDWHIGTSGKVRTGPEVVEEYKNAKEKFTRLPDFDKKLLGWDDNGPLLAQEENLISLAASEEPDARLTRTITEAFIQLVRGELWEQIQLGEFVEGTRSVDVLLSSNTKAFQYAHKGLTDYDCIRALLDIKDGMLQPGDFADPIFDEDAFEPDTPHTVGTAYTSNSSFQSNSREVPFATKLVKSAVFQGTILFVILCNAVVIFMDPGPNSDDSMMFAIIDCFFMVFYLAEFILKLKVMGKKYFLDAWNALDFMCVILGLFAINTAFLVEYGVLSSNAISSEMMLIRLGRVFKLLRIMRVVGFLKFVRKMNAQYNRKRISPMLAVHLELIFTLRGFVSAHVRSHRKFLRYFGTQNQRCVCGNKMMPDSNFCRKCGAERPADMPKGTSSALGGCEHARCILESWTAVFNAAIVGSMEIGHVDQEGTWLLEALCTLRDTNVVTNELTNFIMEAAQAGVILPKSAEFMIHPMHHHMRSADKLLAEVHQGIIGEAVKKQRDGRRRSENNVPRSENGLASPLPASLERATSQATSYEEDKTKPEGDGIPLSPQSDARSRTRSETGESLISGPPADPLAADQNTFVKGSNYEGESYHKDEEFLI